jgi:3-oxoacyl-[acyl-carrier protein] reductase
MTADFGRLDGLTALVTGAGSDAGIGFATAHLLGRLGASVVIAATSTRVHDRVDELGLHGIAARGFIGDLTDPAAVDALANEAGPVDVLVNNAGMTSVSTGSENGSLLGTSPEVWHASLDRNLTTAYAVTRALVPGMIDRGFGRIIMVSSVTGPLVAYPGDVAYAAAKAGMTGLMRALAVEVGDHGITVNAVAPGWIDTASATDEERRMGRATPLGRPGTADEVAAVIAMCCLRESSYLTGQVIAVDGGNVIQDDKRLVSD